MSSHLLGVLEPSVVLQVNRYAGSAGVLNGLRAVVQTLVHVQ